MSLLKIGLIWYVITLTIYGILLNIFREYEILSAIYHISLLFPLVLVVLKREKLRDIGFRKGIFDESALILILGLPIMFFISQIFIFEGTISIVLGYSLFSSIIIASVTEEVFFRGFMQEKFYNTLNRKYLSIVIGAILFGLIHLPRLSIGMYSIEGFIVSFILGGLFGWVYSEGKTLMYPVVFHALWNLAMLIS